MCEGFGSQTIYFVQAEIKKKENRIALKMNNSREELSYKPAEKQLAGKQGTKRLDPPQKLKKGIHTQKKRDIKW